LKENAEEKLENYPEKGDLRGRSRKVVGGDGGSGDSVCGCK
jgi:hypothetical protein